MPNRFRQRSGARRTTPAITSNEPPTPCLDGDAEPVAVLPPRKISFFGVRDPEEDHVGRARSDLVGHDAGLGVGEVAVAGPGDHDSWPPLADLRPALRPGPPGGPRQQVDPEAPPVGQAKQGLEEVDGLATCLGSGRRTSRLAHTTDCPSASSTSASSSESRRTGSALSLVTLAALTTPTRKRFCSLTADSASSRVWSRVSGSSGSPKTSSPCVVPQPWSASCVVAVLRLVGVGARRRAASRS